MEDERKIPGVRRIRAELAAGPWLDGEPCVRFVDLLETQSLFDLHDALAEAVSFEGEYPFRFFLAESPAGPREAVPPGFGEGMEPGEADLSAYEDVPAAASFPPEGSAERLHWSFLGADGEWVFALSPAGSVPRRHDALYPEVAVELSEGPDPAQYGYGLDDFAEDAEGLGPGAWRGPDPAPGGGAEDGEDDDEDDDEGER